MAHNFQKVMTAFNNGSIENAEVQEYLQTTALTAGELWQSTIQDTIAAGSAPMICMREALPVYNMTTGTETRTVEQADTYLAPVAEGADIPLTTDTFSTVTFVATKYGRRPLISNELIADAKFGVIEGNISRSGRYAENTLNQLAITEMIDTAGLSYDTLSAAGNQGKVALSEAIELVKDAGFIPDSVVITAGAEKILRDEFVSSEFGQGEQVRSQGYIGNLFGLKVYTLTVASAGTADWGSAADEIGMVVYDSSAFAEIGMRDDIHHNKFDDDAKDLIGLSVLMRMDVEVLQPNSGCVVVY